jgi:nucleotide-binding universal stress UspA family protein
MTGSVVVGFNGTPEAEAALIWAGHAARARHCELTVAVAGVVLSETEREAGEPDEGRSLAEHALDLLQGPGGMLAASAIVRDAPPTRLLSELTDNACLLVLGRAEENVVEATLGGSVAAHMVNHSPCPVILVPAEPAPTVPTGTVLAAVSVRDAAPAVLRLAIEQAALNGGRVLAVHRPDAKHPRELSMLQATIARRQRDHPAVPIELRLVHDLEAAVAVEVPAADLLVVGLRGAADGRRAGRLAATARRLAFRSPVPVAVVGPTPAS